MDIDDGHLDVCQNIETGLKLLYERHADLTDSICIFALENAKIAMRKHCEFARKRSVKLHSDYGARGYYEFIRGFL